MLQESQGELRPLPLLLLLRLMLQQQQPLLLLLRLLLLRLLLLVTHASFLFSSFNRNLIVRRAVMSLKARVCGNVAARSLTAAPLRLAWFTTVLTSFNNIAYRDMTWKAMRAALETTGTNKRWHSHVIFVTLGVSVRFVAAVHGWRVHIQVKYQMSTCVSLVGASPAAPQVLIGICLSHLFAVISRC